MKPPPMIPPGFAPPRRAVAATMLAAALVLAGCAADSQKIAAVHAVNAGFRAEYERMIGDLAIRKVALPRREALVAMRVALAGLGMHTEAQDLDLGLLVSAGPAPRPLSDAEWQAASALDTPLLRRLIEPHVGVAAGFVEFEPQGLDVLISATVIDAGDQSQIELTVRLRETAPPRSGWPRREYISPNVLRAGLQRIWTAYEREVRGSLTRP